MILITWWAATITILIAATATAFCSYWLGYSAGRRDRRTQYSDHYVADLIDELFEQDAEIEALWDEIERARTDAHKRHGGTRLTPEEIVGFRRIIKGDK
jgi:hypothetical protein